MTPSDAAVSFNLYFDREFFDAQTCDELLSELFSAPDSLATVYGISSETGSVHDRVRKAVRLMPSSETVERVRRRLLETREEVGAHFGISLKGCEDPQFLRYRVDDFFVAHQDGNTGVLLNNREQSRKVSVVVFLNRESPSPEAGSYGGGSLVFSEWRPGRSRGRYSLMGEAGMMVAFPSETTHEVLPVTSGERYTIVSWYG
jgi:SM-20-related protein